MVGILCVNTPSYLGENNYHLKETEYRDEIDFEIEFAIGYRYRNGQEVG
jgi:hypothetical protein